MSSSEFLKMIEMMTGSSNDSTLRNSKKAEKILKEKTGKLTASINCLTNEERGKLEFEKNKNKAILRLQQLKPYPNINNYRYNELQAIENKNEYKLTIWDKLFKKTKSIMEEFDRIIKKEISEDAIRHNHTIQRYVREANIYNDLRKKMKEEYGVNSIVDYQEICFMLALYNLDKITFKVTDDFIRSHLLKMADSFRNKFSKLNKSNTDISEKRHILSNWTKMLDSIEIEESENNVNNKPIKKEDNFLDTSDIEYSINILKNI